MACTGWVGPPGGPEHAPAIPVSRPKCGLAGMGEPVEPRYPPRASAPPRPSGTSQFCVSARAIPTFLPDQDPPDARLGEGPASWPPHSFRPHRRHRFPVISARLGLGSEFPPGGRMGSTQSGGFPPPACIKDWGPLPSLHFVGRGRSDSFGDLRLESVNTISQILQTALRVNVQPVEDLHRVAIGVLREGTTGRP